MKTKEALIRSNELELLAFECECLSIKVKKAGYVVDAKLILMAADKLSSEAAFLWDNRDPPSLITADNVVVLRKK